jgi:hypothetical protein
MSLVAAPMEEATLRLTEGAIGKLKEDAKNNSNFKRKEP